MSNLFIIISFIYRKLNLTFTDLSTRLSIFLYFELLFYLFFLYIWMCLFILYLILFYFIYFYLVRKRRFVWTLNETEVATPWGCTEPPKLLEIWAKLKNTQSWWHVRLKNWNTRAYTKLLYMYNIRFFYFFLSLSLPGRKLDVILFYNILCSHFRLSYNRHPLWYRLPIIII